MKQPRGKGKTRVRKLPILLVGMGLAGNPTYLKTFERCMMSVGNAYSDIVAKSQLATAEYKGVVIVETMKKELGRAESVDGRGGVLNVLRAIKAMPERKQLPTWVLIVGKDLDSAWSHYAEFEFIQGVFPMARANQNALAVEIRTWLDNHPEGIPVAEDASEQTAEVDCNVG